MGAISLSGAKTQAMLSTRGTLVNTGDLDPNAWYEIVTVGATSTLPIGEITAVFKTPDVSATTAVITLSAGDSVYPLTLERLCKTDAEVEFEEGTIDVTDDCESGFNASILDGYKTISGSLNGFLKFDEATGQIVSAEQLLGRFLNRIEDDGEGVYTETKASNEKLILFICLNKTAKVGEIQNWLIVPAILSSLGTGAGLKEAQKRDISWTKAQGYASLYERTVFADDVL